MKTSLDYLTRYMRMFDNAKVILAPYANPLTEDGKLPNPKYKRSAHSWILRAKSRHWGIDGERDVFEVCLAYYLVREYKGRDYVNKRRLTIQSLNFYDRIQSN